MKWSFIKRNFKIGVVAFLVVAVCASAQVGTTSVRGTVTDKSGAAVVGAKVTLGSSAQAIQREMQTSQTGEYEFIALPPGTYALAVEVTNFRKFENKNVQLLVNSPTTINVTLEVGATTETVEVSAQEVTLNTTDASLGNAFGENQVKQLPLEGRNVPDLLSLQAGVLYTGNRTDINTDVDTRNGAVNGARSDQSNVTLDGIPVNNEKGNAFTSVLPVTLDSVQEFRVTTSNYNSDQGSSSGAQVALVTKSGTNSFHGSAYEYNRNTYTSANDYFIKAAQIQGCLGNGTPLTAKQCNQAPKLIRNVFGTSVGGPIKKDRFYFFLNYEGTRRLEEASAVRTIPTDSLRDGVVFYQCKNTATVATDCPGGTIKGLSGNSYTIPGPVTNSDGSITAYFAVNNTQITQMDPQHKGADPATLAYLNSFPHPNDGSVGDGFNYSGFRFSSPITDTKNWYIAKFDYNITQDAKQRISWSGALANESNTLKGEYLPSSPTGSLFNYTNPEDSFVNYNKGFIINYSGVITNSLVNNFRYGYIRESVGDIGDSNQQYIILRGITQGVTRSTAFQRPINTFADDLSWSRGKHTLQFGTQLIYVRNPRNNTTNSFSDGAANASWLDVSGMLVKCGAKGSPFCPSNNGFPAGAGSFANSYDFPMMALLGMVTEDDATYNYKKDGSVLAQGAPVQRHFAEDGWEFYGQDAWKVKPNLTVTFGLRYSLFSPPWETNGLQVSPSVNLSDWFNLRAKDMENGIPSNQDPLISYSLGGPSNPGGKPGLWNWDYKNFGPRLAVAWSPKGSDGFLKSLFGDGGKTVIRAGFSTVYDNIGQGILDTFDQAGSFGLATTLSNPAGIETAACAPRLTDMHTIPTTDLGCPSNNNVPAQMFIPAPPGKFPQTFPSSLDTGGFAITWGLDQNIKTPYSYTLDLSVGRELPKGFSLQVAYVGRLSHRLLTQSDLAQPLDFFDKKSGLDYFKAITALAKVYRTGVATDNFSPSMVPANVVQYWKDVLQPLEGPNAGNGGAGGAYAIGNCTTKNGPTSTTSPVVAVYDLFCGGNLNETTPLFTLDYFGISDANNISNCGTTGAPACNPSYLPSTGGNTFFNSQYSSLYAWRANSNANYHAMQVNLQHKMQHGVQFDFNYTFSKSIDISSDAARIGAWSGLGGQVINSWDPNAMRAVSDFDSKHQFNANWIAELPVGKGKMVAGNAHGLLDVMIGGWQLSGLFHITSGLPFNVFNGFQWPTNWQLGGNAFLVSPVNTGVFKSTDSSGNAVVSVFKNGTDAINAFTNPFPGESGARNQVRGDGFFNVDLGLAKRWRMPWSERQSLQLRWEVFNVTNSNRFDVQSIAPELDISSTFGNYTGLLTNPRVMQFALRFEF